MALDTAFNFAQGTVSQGYDASATSIVLNAGDGARFGTPPFNAVWWNATTYGNPSNDPNREIVRVTAINVDTFTITRGQETTSGGLAATAKNTAGVTYKIANLLTAKMIDDISALSVDIGTETVYVTDEGAIGDGVADDTAAIVSAIGSGGRLVVFPPGTYLCNGNIALADNLALLGAGQGLSTIKVANSAGAFHLFKDGGTARLNVTLDGLTINGNSGGNPTGLDLLHLETSITNLVVKNCELTDSPGNSIALCNNGGTVAAKRILISDCSILRAAGHLIEIENPNNANEAVTLSRLRMEDPGYQQGAGQNKACILARGNRVKISDVTCDNVDEDNIGIHLEDSDVTHGDGADNAELASITVVGTTDATTVSKGFKIDSNSVSVVGCHAGACDYGFQIVGNEIAMHACGSNACDSALRVEGDRLRCYAGNFTASTTGIDIQATAADTTLEANYLTGNGTAVTDSGTSTHAHHNLGWKTHAVLVGIVQDSGTGSGHDEVIAHGLAVTPALEDCAVGIIRETGGEVPVSRLWIEAVDATNVTVMSWVSGTTGNDYKHVVRIDARP